MVFFLLTFWTIIIIPMYGLDASSTTSILDEVHKTEEPNYPRFQPEKIELEQSDLFVTQEITVTLVNPGDEELNIRGTQIDDPQWLIENLPTLPMPAQSQKKIRVVFIPKIEGRSETTLIVYTSKGEISLDVVGHGGENIYELQPVNVRMLKGTSLGQKIRIRNYRGTHLRISTMEMRGDDIRYEWKAKEIEPGGRKTVAIVRFSSDNESGLFQARLRIETSDNEVLSIPVQISIVIDDDEFTLVEAEDIDFGMMIDDKEERVRELKLSHGRQEAIVVTHIEAKTFDNCLTIGDIPDQEPIMCTLSRGVIVPPDELYSVTNISWCSCVNRSIFDLKGILLVYTNTTTLEVEYVGQVIIGSLYWSEENTHFHFDTSKDSPIYQNIHTRAIRLRNRFPIHIELVSASIEHEDFKLLQFDRQVLEPLERYSGCRLALRWTSNIFRYDTELVIETNITRFRIPLSVFDGHFTISTSTDSNPLFQVHTLQYEKPASYEDTLAEYISTETLFWHDPGDEKNNCEKCPLCCSIEEGEVHATINFGTIPRGAKISQTLYVYNENPVPLGIELYPETRNPYYRLFCKVLDRHKKHYRRGFGFSLAIGLSLIDDKKEEFDEGLQQTYIFFKAVNQYMEHQIMRIRIQWREVDGALKIHPNPIIFNPSFPGVETEKISILTENLYNTTLYMGDDFVLTDPRFKFEQKYNVIPPLTRIEIGTIEFDPSITEIESDYFQPPIRDYSSWNRDRGPELAELDMITERMKKWSIKRAQGRTRFNALLELLFYNKGTVKLMTSGGLQLPQLTSETLHFGDVRVGQFKESMIEIRNPFAFPIRLQLLNPVSDTVFSVNTRYKDATGVAGPYGTIALGPILFEPSWGADFVNHIYIRNNITGLESIMVTGTGKQGVLVFGEQIPDGLEVNKNELVLPFRSESFGVEKTEAGPQIMEGDGATIMEESFYVTNSGNEAVVLENLFLVEPGDEVNRNAIGCNSLKQQNESFHGLSLLGCEGLPMTINPNKQKIFKLKLHYFNQGPIVKSDLVAATSWGYFRTTIRFEVPLEVYSLLLSLRPKRFSGNAYYLLFFIIIILGYGMRGQISVAETNYVAPSVTTVKTTTFKPVIEEKVVPHLTVKHKTRTRSRSSSDSRKSKKFTSHNNKRNNQHVSDKQKQEPQLMTKVEIKKDTKEPVVEEIKRSRHKSKKKKNRKKKSAKQKEAQKLEENNNKISTSTNNKISTSTNNKKRESTSSNASSSTTSSTSVTSSSSSTTNSTPSTIPVKTKDKTRVKERKIRTKEKRNKGTKKKTPNISTSTTTKSKVHASPPPPSIRKESPKIRKKAPSFQKEREEPPKATLENNDGIFNLTIEEPSSSPPISLKLSEDFGVTKVTTKTTLTSSSSSSTTKKTKTNDVKVKEKNEPVQTQRSKPEITLCLSPSPKTLDEPNADLARSPTTRTEDSECSTEHTHQEAGNSNEGSELSTSMESMVDGSSITEFPSQIPHRERIQETEVQTYSQICSSPKRFEKKSNYDLLSQLEVEPLESPRFDAPWTLSHHPALNSHDNIHSSTYTPVPPLWQTHSSSPTSDLPSPRTNGFIDINDFGQKMNTIGQQTTSGFFSTMPTFSIEPSSPVVMPFIERKEENSSDIVGVRALNSPKNGPQRNPSPIPSLDRNGSVGIIGPRRDSSSYSSGKKTTSPWGTQDLRPDEGSLLGLIHRDVESLFDDNLMDTHQTDEFFASDDHFGLGRSLNSAASAVNFPLRNTSSSFASTLFSPELKPGISEEKIEQAKQQYGSKIFAQFSELNPQAPVFKPRTESSNPFS